MRISQHPGQWYLAGLTDDERGPEGTPLLWAVEAGRALLLRDPDVARLAREERFSPDFLDRLADAHFLAGARVNLPRQGTDPIGPPADPNWRP